MITFHATARRTQAGFLPMVTLRGERGQMVGSKVTQNGNAFETYEDAKRHALTAAFRVAMANPETMTVAR
jgi:hypothetical protein